MSSEYNVSYDRASDVLYLSKSPAVAARSREVAPGLVIRYDIDTGVPIGATVIDFAEFWGDRIEQLIDSVSVHMRVPRSVAEEIVRDQIE